MSRPAGAADGLDDRALAEEVSVRAIAHFLLKKGVGLEEPPAQYPARRGGRRRGGGGQGQGDDRSGFFSAAGHGRPGVLGGRCTVRVQVCRCFRQSHACKHTIRSGRVR